MSKGKLSRRTAVLGSVLSGLVGASMLPQIAVAHGYTTQPPARGYACVLGLNSNCGGVNYEPQSVGETEKGFPARGPADGKIASGGVRPDFSALDEQTASRWHKTLINQRDIEISWYYAIGHKTTHWQYFITRPDWNPNIPLARAAFEATPFCEKDGGGQPPRDDFQPGPGRETHQCSIPADRSGHHVILGVWTIDDTVNAFYNVMDVNIDLDDGAVPEWRQVGSIAPHRDLQVGDKVKARAFVGAVESAQYSASITIDNSEEGLGANWSYKLAQRINDSQSLIQAGQRDTEGNVHPVKGANLIFAKAQSGVSSYQLDFEGKPIDDAYLHLHDLKPDYTLKEGSTRVDFSVMTNRTLKVTSRLFDEANKQVGHALQHVEPGTVPVALPAQSKAGKHLLKVVGVDKQGRVLLQQERDVLLVEADNAGHDYVFPQSIQAYKAGTRVLQSKTGEVFECKPFPAEGWCRAYSQSASHYEPGVGSHWADAWIKR